MVLFDVDLFSPCFYMESPISYIMCDENIFKLDQETCLCRTHMVEKDIKSSYIEDNFSNF